MNKTKACEGDIRKQPQHIVVGVNSARSELRVCVLLKTLPDIQIDKICSGCNMDALVFNASLVIGSESVALKGVLLQKPVLVVGRYGSGGLLTPENLIDQYHTGFLGRLHGEKDEYFSLEQLMHDIEKSRYLSKQALEYMCNRMKNETLNMRISQ